MKHRIDIDCLRALAIILVIIFHASIGIYNRGFWGVDVFFVISGFLMTCIIVDKLKNNKFNLLSFYASRTRRIVPALFTCVLFFYALAYISGLYAIDVNTLKDSAISAILGVSNIYFRMHSGYFDISATSHVFLHTWSLSTEIQFYLAYPIILVVGNKLFKIKFAYILVSLFLTSIILNIYLLTTYTHQNFIFFMLPARMWEFIFGGFVALTKWSPVNQQAKRFFVLSGSALIILSVFAYPPPPPPTHSSINLLKSTPILPCFGASLFLIGGTNIDVTNILRKTIFNPVVCFIGIISYSLYLWHWPILTLYTHILFVFQQQSTFFNFSLIIATIFICAYFSWRYIEKPIREQFGKYGNLIQFLMLIASVAIILLLISSSMLIKPMLFESQRNYMTSDTNIFVVKHEDILGDKNQPISFLLIGDSHAAMFTTLFSQLASEHKISGKFLSQNPTGIIHESGFSVYKGNIPLTPSRRVLIQSEDKYDTIYISMYWVRYLKASLIMDSTENSLPFFDSMDYTYKREDIDYDTITALTKGLEYTIEYFQSKGAKVIYFILPIPEQYYSIPPHAANLSIFYTEPFINDKLGTSYSDYLERQREILMMFNRLKDKYKIVKLLNPIPFLLNDSKSKFIVAENKHSLYIDNHHLSIYGASKLTDLFTFTN